MEVFFLAYMHAIATQSEYMTKSNRVDWAPAESLLHRNEDDSCAAAERAAKVTIE